MTTENPEPQTLPKLLSVPGLASVAVFGILVVVVSRLFGPENVMREIFTELLASFGSTILVLAIFGLLFRSGLQRLLRGAPGGETFARSADRLDGIVELPQPFDVVAYCPPADLQSSGKLRTAPDSSGLQQAEQRQQSTRGLVHQSQFPQLKRNEAVLNRP